MSDLDAPIHVLFLCSKQEGYNFNDAEVSYSHDSDWSILFQHKKTDTPEETQSWPIFSSG